MNWPFRKKKQKNVIPLGSCPECMGRSVRRVEGQKVCASCLSRQRIVVIV